MQDVRMLQINVCDVLLMLALLGISITAGVREAQVNTFDFFDTVNQGAFAAAAALGLLAVLFYIAHIACSIPIYLVYRARCLAK